MTAMVSDTVSLVHAAKDQVAVSLVTDASAGISLTRDISEPAGATNTLTVLSQGHTPLATAVFGRLSETSTLSVMSRWQTRANRLHGTVQRSLCHFENHASLCSSTTREPLRQSYYLTAVAPNGSKPTARLIFSAPQCNINVVGTPACSWGANIATKGCDCNNQLKLAVKLTTAAIDRATSRRLSILATFSEDTRLGAKKPPMEQVIVNLAIGTRHVNIEISRKCFRHAEPPKEKVPQ